MDATTQAPPRKRTREFPTEWSGWLETYTPEGVKQPYCRGAEGRTLEAFFADAFRGATFILRTGRRVVLDCIEERCSRCHGSGSRCDRNGRDKPCPECKGRPIVRTLGPIPLEVHPQAQVIER